MQADALGAKSGLQEESGDCRPVMKKYIVWLSVHSVKIRKVKSCSQVLWVAPVVKKKVNACSEVKAQKSAPESLLQKSMQGLEFPSVYCRSGAKRIKQL